MTTIFGKILKGEIPCSKVYEDDLVLAFDELASNALRHGESPVVATVIAGFGGWLLDVSDRAPDVMPAPVVDRDPSGRRRAPEGTASPVLQARALRNGVV
jgi:anti-sigma regulatory factor (Ser/Thr protein kinase)